MHLPTFYWRHHILSHKLDVHGKVSDCGAAPLQTYLMWNIF